MSDVSNKMIFVLVILTLVISVFSTVILVTSGESPIAGSQVSQTSPKDTAVIGYRIANPPQTVDSATGKIAFTINR